MSTEEDASTSVVVEDPTTGTAIATVDATDPATVEETVEAATAAQPKWADRPIPRRLKIIDRVRERILDRREALATRISRETGKSRADAMAGDLGPALDTTQFLLDHGDTLLEEPVPVRRFVATGDSTVVRSPVGVVGVITPWNYPFGIPMAEILPALFAGNAVVLKPAEEATTTALAVRDLLHAAGVPESVFAVVPGPGSVTGQALANAAIDHLSFTGSYAVGFDLRDQCQSRGVSTTLELGGSDPAIVLPDADLELTAAGLTWVRFTVAGQSCGAPKRVFPVEAIADPLTEAIIDRVEALTIGPSESESYEVGPLISADAVETIHDQVQRSVELGAEVLTGGEPLDREGYYYPPTVLGNVTMDMPVMTEETFGPVLPIHPVSDVDAAIRAANDTRFGLTGSVWTTDQSHGREIAQQIDAGTVTVNDHLYTFVLHDTPWGGRKDSGDQFTHGRWAIDNVTEAQHVHVAPGDSAGRLGRTMNRWWFPYDSGTGDRVGNLLEIRYGSNTLDRLQAVGEYLRSSISRGTG